MQLEGAFVIVNTFTDVVIAYANTEISAKLIVDSLNKLYGHQMPDGTWTYNYYLNF